MKYSADLYSQLTLRKMCRVVFECRDPELVHQYAKSRGCQKGLRNVQFLDVRNVKIIEPKGELK